MRDEGRACAKVIFPFSRVSKLTAVELLEVPQVVHSELQDVGLLQLALSNLKKIK